LQLAWLGERELVSTIHMFVALPVTIPFSTGRVDCTFITPDSRLPHGDTVDSVDFFATEFGLTTRESVAILGTYTQGRITPNKNLCLR